MVPSNKYIMTVRSGPAAAAVDRLL